MKRSRDYSNIKKGWATIAGKKHHYNSLAEYNIALYLQWLKEHNSIADWAYEPQIFYFPVKRGINNYKPDFRVTEITGSHYWIEVKGYMDSNSRTRLKRFEKYYPEERMEIYDSKRCAEVKLTAGAFYKHMKNFPEN